MKNKVLCSIAAALLVIGLAWAGGARALGAHPWWAVDVALIGAPAGALIALAVPRGHCRIAGGLAVLLTGGAGLLAHLGKLRFAASYAEDQLAGQMWFFGWVAACAGLAGAVALGLRWLARR